MSRTSIQWTDETWNPVRGCSRVSPGCQNCYAEVQALRITRFDRGRSLPLGQGSYDGLVHAVGGEARWTGAVRLVPGVLDAPLRMRQPRRIFANSMSDLFHESLSDEDIDRVFAVMALAHWHTFQILTKRAERMRAYFSELAASRVRRDALDVAMDEARERTGRITRDEAMSIAPPGSILPAAWTWPLPNVWLGVSVEDQQRADERIPHLLATPAAVRFLSVEPLLGPIDLNHAAWGEGYPRPPLDIQARQIAPDGVGWRAGFAPLRAVDWAIIGGESGKQARPCNVAWIRSLRDQCRAASVACFVKQFGARAYDSEHLCGTWAPYDKRTPTKPDGAGGEMALGNLILLKDSHGGDPEEWPADLRIRELPPALTK